MKQSSWNAIDVMWGILSTAALISAIRCSTEAWRSLPNSLSISRKRVLPQ